LFRPPKTGDLAVGHHALDQGHIGLVYLGLGAQMTNRLGGLLRQDVVFECLLTLETGGGFFKTLCGPAVCLDLWHGTCLKLCE